MINFFSANAGWINSNSIQFASASTQYLDFGNNVNDDYNVALSWSFWCNFTSFPGVQTSIIAKVSGALKGYVIDINASKGIEWFMGNAYPSNCVYVKTANNTVSTATWYHVVVTASGSHTAAGVHIYVNSVDKTLTTIQDNNSSTSITTTTLTFGVDNEGVIEDPMNGLLAQVSHWSAYALSGSEVTTLYNSGTPINPLTTSFGGHCDHFWPLGTPPDTISASGIKDRAGSVNGSPTNSPTISSSHP